MMTANNVRGVNTGEYYRTKAEAEAPLVTRYPYELFDAFEDRQPHFGEKCLGVLNSTVVAGSARLGHRHTQ